MIINILEVPAASIKLKGVPSQETVENQKENVRFFKETLFFPTLKFIT